VLFTVRNRSPLEEVLQPRQIVIDFEPEFATHYRGRPITDDGVLARYYNNIGAEFLVHGDRRAAYAHFKAAMLADRGFSAAYGNLALLYRQEGLETDAEMLLRQAIALAEDPEVPMRELHRMLVQQGRQKEALAYARQLQSRSDKDPYYWISQGIRHLNEGDARGAVQALRRAEEITTGFGEIHRYLAIAYWQLGEKAHADEQLTLLAGVDPNGPGTAKLRRKFHAPAQ
jgi:Flp pilus assembly protein TadD